MRMPSSWVSRECVRRVEALRGCADATEIPHTNQRGIATCCSLTHECELRAQGYTPLLEACAGGHEALAKLLIKRKSDVNATNDNVSRRPAFGRQGFGWG
eukprot:2507129-Rhodomonas_salina.1